MRPIKFRFWSEVSKEIVPPSSILVLDSTDGQVLDSKADDYVNLLPMQFTGLNDKNGKEIYGGDIVKEDNFFIREVHWRNDLGCWNIGRYRDGEVFESFSFEIVGNIYENPELLNDLQTNTPQ
jgi:uncharacterized phage protein (TIGR01671 family)